MVHHQDPGDINVSIYHHGLSDGYIKAPWLQIDTHLYFCNKNRTHIFF